MFYHLPLKHWVRALFSQPELVPFLHLFQEATPPPGSVRLSNGFHEKAIGNPDINSESRNQAVIGTADGVPIFGIDKSKRTGLPFMLRTANAPDTVSLKLFNCHLHGYLMGEFFTTNPDPAKKNPVRTIHAPKSTGAAMMVLADDLLTAYRDGFMVADLSKLVTDPLHHFRCKVVLLFWYVCVNLNILIPTNMVLIRINNHAFLQDR